MQKEGNILREPTTRHFVDLEGIGFVMFEIRNMIRNSMIRNVLLFDNEEIEAVEATYNEWRITQ